MPAPKARSMVVAALVLVLATLVVATSGANFLRWASDLRAKGEAYTQHRAAAEARRHEVRLRFDQAAAMLHLREYEHAITALHRVLELAPEMPEAQANMGFALLGQGKYRAAADFFTAAIALKPDQANAHYGLALAHAGVSEFGKAREAMRVFVHLVSPGDPFRAKGAALLEAWAAAEPAETRAGSHGEKGG